MSEALINSQTQREWAYRALTAEARIEELEAKLVEAERALDISCVIIDKLMENKDDAEQSGSGT